MTPRNPTRFAALFALLAPLVLGACGASDEAPASAEPTTPAVPIAGRYEVKGTTFGLESGDKRGISGTIILAVEGDRYTSTFNLATTFPDPEEPLPAEVIGKGDGRVEGRTLRGTAETQLVVAGVPGVDPGFALIPRSMVSTRISSESVATVAADGTVSIEIENKPAAGETHYQPTRTTLNGRRISAARLGTEKPVSAQGR